MGVWRSARGDEDGVVTEMCLGFHAEDPGLTRVDHETIRRTLTLFRREPHRGRAVVLDIDDVASGYALLVAFWSNQLGGLVCEIDELYVRPELRGRGYGGSLIPAIERGDVWEPPAVAIALGVSDSNTRARALYQRLGFERAGTTMVRRVATR